MKKHRQRTLVLNSDFTAHSIVNWTSAMKLIFENKNDSNIGAYIVDFYRNDFVCDSRGNKYPIPSVIALVNYIKRKNTIPFSKKNVLIRDKFTCQYCGERFAPIELTYDHVIPRCKWSKEKYGTPTHWTNIVTACLLCNKKKGGRTPKEAKMQLLNLPSTPNAANYVHGLGIRTKIPLEWHNYLPTIYLEHNLNFGV